MENPAIGGAPKRRTGKIDTPDDTPTTHDPQAAVRAIEAGLVGLPDDRELSVILRDKLTVGQCLYGAAAFTWALEPAVADQLAQAIHLEVVATRHGPVAAEAERMRRQWTNYCAEPKRRMRR